MTARRPLVIGLLAVALFAGCGGDDGGSGGGGGGGGGSSAAEWAEDVCSAITTWNESISSTVDSLKSGDLSEDELRGAVEDVESATSNFVDDLRGLGRPETEAGAQAKESLDRLARNIEDNLSTLRSAVDSASGLSGIVAATGTATVTLSTMEEQLSSTFAELQELDAGGELEAAFSEADSCNQLESGGS